MTSSYVTNISRLSGYVVAGGFLLRSAMEFAGATVLYVQGPSFLRPQTPARPHTPAALKIRPQHKKNARTRPQHRKYAPWLFFGSRN